MKPPVKFLKKMKKGDRVMLLIFAALSAAALALFIYSRTAAVPSGRIVTVAINGFVVDTIRLDELREPVARIYETGSGFNTIYADSGGARVSEADCPDRRCVRRGRISRPGEDAVCLPHRFILRIAGDGGDGLDGGTY